MGKNFELWEILALLFVIIFSVSLHELAHGVAAYWLGDNTAKDAGRLTLNPIKNIDPYMSILLPVVLYLLNGPVFGAAKPVPVDNRNLKWKEWGMALVAVAGPATNFLLALGAFLIGHFTGWIYGSGGKILEFVFLEMVLINIGFMIFNLIPIPPLDGSRVLYAIAPDGARTWLSSMEAYGFVVIYALILFFGQVFSGVMIGGMEGVLKFFYWIVGG